MRFKLEHPLEGSIRYVKRFAFFPKRFGNERIWLESYYEKQVWRRSFNLRADHLCYTELHWTHEYFLLADNIELAPLTRALE